MEHFRVNWTDGMRIGKDNFIDNENYLLSQQYFSNLLHVFPNRYGIICNHLDNQQIGETYPTILFSIEKNTKGDYSIIIYNIHFSAISPGGTVVRVSMDSFAKEHGKTHYRIDVDSDIIHHAEQIFLVLLFLPFETIEFGNVDKNSTEAPLRIPYCRIKCSILSVSSKADSKSQTSNIVGPNHFPIAKLLVQNKEITVDDDYIPPCCNFFSHTKLRTELKRTINDLSKTESFIIETLREISSNSSGSNKTILNFLSQLFHQLNYSVTNTRNYLEHFGTALSPYQYVVTFLSLCQNFFNHLNSDLINSDFLKNQWERSHIRVQDFEFQVKDNLSQYEHYDLPSSMKLCHKILNNFFIEIVQKNKYFTLLSGTQTPEKPQKPSTPLKEDIPEF